MYRNSLYIAQYMCKCMLYDVISIHPTQHAGYSDRKIRPIRMRTFCNNPPRQGCKLDLITFANLKQLNFFK